MPYIMKQSKHNAVFVVPAFELASGIPMPREKEEMVELFDKNLSRQIRILLQFLVTKFLSF
jgi:hypothetical protein